MDAPLLHFYDQNFSYAYSRQAMRDPLDTVWLIPSNAVDSKLIPEKKGFDRILNPDFRAFEYRAQKPSEFHSWNGKKWVEDSEAKKEFIIQKNTIEQDRCVLVAEQEITLLERKVKLKRVTAAEIALLDALYNYTVDLSELDLSLDNLEFPPLPK